MSTGHWECQHCGLRMDLGISDCPDCELRAFEAWQEGGLRLIGEEVRRRKRRTYPVLDAQREGYQGA